ncbi:MAG: anthranilate phosphoribosyltransferase [Planctomycetota bacterium]
MSSMAERETEEEISMADRQLEEGTVQHLTDSLLSGTDLSEADASSLLLALTSEAVADASKGAMLGALRVKGETAGELRGLATCMRKLASTLPYVPEGPLVDTCGTGGDGSKSLNISTATALVVAGCGISVAKHGNRSVSSSSGSADVLESLGVKIPETAESAAALLKATGFTFLFAPIFHGATKAVVPVRRAIGARTVFNLLGPLTNPARPRYQLLGAYSPEATSLMARCLAGMDIGRAFCVHGSPGWDEATPIGPFICFDVQPGKVMERMIDPKRYKLPRCTPEDLRGGGPQQNAARLRALLAGETGAHRDAVVLNAGLTLEVAGVVPNLGDGIECAITSLQEGKAERVLDNLVEESHAL